MSEWRATLSASSNSCWSVRPSRFSERPNIVARSSYAASLIRLLRPLREVCFRLEQACALLGTAPETLLTPELLARLLASEQGGRKQVGSRRFSVVLNQADDPARIAAGEQTLALLRKKYEVQGVLTYFDERERA